MVLTQAQFSALSEENYGSFPMQKKYIVRLFDGVSSCALQMRCSGIDNITPNVLHVELAISDYSFVQLQWLRLYK